MKRKEIFIYLISGLFIILFLYSSLSKWLDFDDFVHQMKNQPFNRRYLPVLLYILPSIEIITALLLILDRTRLVALWSCLSLMVLFSGYIILIKLNFYGRIPCSCGGVISKLDWTQHLIFNLFFVGLGAIGVYLLSHPMKSKLKSLNKTSYA